MVEVVCGYAAVNNGNHCMKDDHCIACSYKAPPNYKELDEAVKKTVEQYGETLRRLKEN